MHAIASSLISYCPDTLSLSVDASDAGIRPGSMPRLASITSTRTGRTATYIYSRTLRCDDGVASFHFDAANAIAAEATPGGLRIFND
jgi:hypothetical protein